jgi:sugar/nucleoside kinase (ribokinase family)
MRDSMKEINQWWDEIMPDTDDFFAEPCDFEEEAEKLGPEDNPTDATEKVKLLPLISLFFLTRK